MPAARPQAGSLYAWANPQWAADVFGVDGQRAPIGRDRLAEIISPRRIRDRQLDAARE